MKEGSGIFGKMVQGTNNDKYKPYHDYKQKENVYHQDYPLYKGER